MPCIIKQLKEMSKFIKKEVFNFFVQFLRDSFEVIAPVGGDIVRFKAVEDGDKVVFELPRYPPKEFFLPHKEKIFCFSTDGKIKEIKPKIKNRVIFLRKCDAAALVMLDKVMLGDSPDTYYKLRREKTMIIEIPCMQTYDECFCDINRLPDNFDLRIVPFKDKYFFQVGSEKGKELLKSPLFKDSDIDIKDMPPLCPITKCDYVVHEKEIKGEETGANDKIWQREAEKCLSCGACTSVCPTCACFELSDEVDISCKTGTKTRKWSSCQLPNFTEVAGGHVFRMDRPLRVKHRILHKFKYFKEQHGTLMCSGCGRCVAACPTGINIFEIVKELK